MKISFEQKTYHYDLKRFKYRQCVTHKLYRLLGSKKKEQLYDYGYIYKKNDRMESVLMEAIVLHFMKREDAYFYLVECPICHRTGWLSDYGAHYGYHMAEEK